MNQNLKALKTELDNLRKDFSRRADELERQIRFMEVQIKASESAAKPIEKNLSDFRSTSKKAAEINPLTEKRQVKPKPDEVKPPPIPQKEKSQGTNQRSKTQKTVITTFFETVLPLLGPAAALIEKFLSIYKHYQSQGKAPVFFMTVAGITALVMGIGYLLQYSFSQFLGPAGKLLIGFTASAVIVLCGMGINKKRPEMDEYASSLIGLGIIMSYLCAYFTGPYYNLLSQIGTFGLLASLTCAAYFLAVTYETRIVAVITLAGGTFAPVFMAKAIQSPQVYLSYMLLLIIAMQVLAKKIKWPTLAYASMLLSFVVIEFTVIGMSKNGQPLYDFLLILHLFFYIFYTFNTMKILQDAALNRTNVLLFSSNLFFFLFIVPQVADGRTTTGILYFANGLIIAAGFPLIPWLRSKSEAPEACRKILQMICLLSVGLLTGFGILSLTAPEFLGLVWGIEALVLIYLAKQYDIFQVRVESYVIFILALLFSFYHAAEWVFNSMVPPPDIFQLEFGKGWFNLILASVLLSSFVYLMEKSRDLLTPIELNGLTMCDELLSLSLSISFLMTIGIFWSPGIWLLSIIPMFLLIYRAKSRQLVLTEYLGLAHFIFLSIPMLASAAIVESFYFTEQVLVGKIARIETFFCLFLIAEFYNRYYANSRLSSFTIILKQLFFLLIPLVFLPGIWHRYIDFFPIAVWVSAGICLALFCFLKYRVLLFELYILVAGSSIISFAACFLSEFHGWQGHSFSSLFAGLGFYAMVTGFWKGLKNEPAGSSIFLQIRKALFLIFTQSFYYLGVFLFILFFAVSGSAALSLLLMTAYFFLIFTIAPMFDSVGNTKKLLFGLVCLSAGGLILWYSSFMLKHGYLVIYELSLLHRVGLYNILALCMYGLSIFQKRPHFQETVNKLGGFILHCWLFHSLTALTYTGALSQLFKQGFGPALSVALVIHATLVLFLTLKGRFQRLISLAVLLYCSAAGKIMVFDLTGFSLVQKMIAFIIIGILLLGAAYQYQKMKNKIIKSSS